MTEQNVSVVLRRPLQTCDFDENGPTNGPVLPAGTAYTFTVEDGILTSECRAVVQIEGAGHADPDDILRAAAEVPCINLQTASDDREHSSTPDWFDCARLDTGAEAIPTCLGDRCRCPVAEVRLKAKATLSTSTPEGRPQNDA